MQFGWKPVPNIIYLYMDHTNNSMAHFYGLPLNSFPMTIIDFHLLTIIVSSAVLGLNASGQTLDSSSVSHCIIVQWLLLGLQGHG